MPEDVHIHIHLHEDDPVLVERVTTVEETVANVEAELTALRDVVIEQAEDLDARLDALEAAQGEFTPEAAAVFSSLRGTLDAMRNRVGDADADGNPAPPPPPEPTP